VIFILIAFYLLTMAWTVLSTKEQPLTEKPARPQGRPILRMLLLTVIFVGVTQLALWMVKSCARWLP
jgi:multisubunit Na+/H+ antiporter MnhC subunit